MKSGFNDFTTKRAKDRTPMDKEQVEVYVDNLIHQTENGAKCLIGKREVWLPWSLIDKGSDVEKIGDKGVIYIPRWLAEKNKLEYAEI